jgi:TIR domain
VHYRVRVNRTMKLPRPPRPALLPAQEASAPGAPIRGRRFTHWRLPKSSSPARPSDLPDGGLVWQACSVSQPPVEARDVFVCHASEDKDVVVRPLVERLAQRYSVWFDEYELRVGDSLRRAIDQGLSNSRFGVVVLSPNFFAKEWPQRELDGLTARETVGGERVILPVWHEVDARAVATFSPALADRLAARTEDGIDAVAEQIAAAVDRLKHGPPPASIAEPVQRAGARAAAEVGADAVALLRDRDDVGLTELLRAERRTLRAAFDEATARWEGQTPTEAIGLELHRSLMPAIDRRALSLLPLIDHDPPRFEVEVEDMVQWLDARPVKSGYVLWHQLPEYAIWWLGRVTGAYAIRQGAFGSARTLLNASFHD